MGYTPFKMKGFSGFGNSPAKDASPSKHRRTKSTAISYEDASAHNASPPTEDHFGHPHGPPPTAKDTTTKPKVKVEKEKSPAEYASPAKQRKGEDMQEMKKRQGKPYKKTTESTIYNEDMSHNKNKPKDATQKYVDYVNTKVGMNKKGDGSTRRDKYGNVLKD